MAAQGGLPRQFCAIGSAKSNIGHLEAAAGIAGLTKVLLQLRHQTLVPSLHSQELNPHIAFEETPFAVQQEVSPWGPTEIVEDGKVLSYPRRAGISSFGAGGSNAHLILEEFLDLRPRRAALEGSPVLVLLSAANANSLIGVAQNLLAWLSSREATDPKRPDLEEIAYTLQVGREPLGERVAFTVSSLAELRRNLELFVAQDIATDFVRGSARQDRGVSAAILAGAEGNQFVQSLIDNRNLVKLAQLWVHGAEVEWEALWRGIDVRRVSLPGYAFDRKRYWVPATSTPREGEASKETRLHPLLHRNESTLRGQVYGSSFNGEEVVWRDHRIAGQKVLCGAAELELALAGASLALENVQHSVAAGRVGATDHRGRGWCRDQA